MSLAIDVNRVRSVLLDDGKWYRVAPLAEGDEKSSFDIDSYEFSDYRAPDGQAWFHQGNEVTGAVFKAETGGVTIFCPLSSIRAVSYEVVPPRVGRSYYFMY